MSRAGEMGRVDRASKGRIHSCAMLVTELISNKNRSFYQQAVPHLKLMKSLYEGMENRSDWDSYIIKLSNTYPTLKALQEELKKAKL